VAIERICLIGFGEVGQMLDAAFPEALVRSSWDIAFPDEGSAQAQAAEKGLVSVAWNAADAAAEADLIISAVTAEAALAAAESVLLGIKKGAYYLDLNSCAPNTKVEAAGKVNARGGHYVEGAVMAPIGPKGIDTPILLGGPYAETFLPEAASVGFGGMEVFAAEYGKASAAKMCRSIMVKGLESLIMEALLTARHYGVEEKMLSSLSNLLSGKDWPALSQYMISRSLQHGKRRAEEMREVAKTVEDAALKPRMSSACSESQDAAAAFADALKEPDLAGMLDHILAAYRAVPTNEET